MLTFPDQKGPKPSATGTGEEPLFPAAQWQFPVARLAIEKSQHWSGVLADEPVGLGHCAGSSVHASISTARKESASSTASPAFPRITKICRPAPIFSGNRTENSRLTLFPPGTS